MSQFLAAVKARSPIFIFAAVSDNRDMKKSNSRPFDTNHPLLKDKERLERILDVMYVKIQKTLFPWRGPRRRLRDEASEFDNVGETERILDGTGISADDVLSEALIGLLQFSPERLHSTWEGLAVRIAENKAKDALDTSQKGLRGTDHRPQLYLVSGDLEREGPDGEMEPAIFDTLPSDWGDPEAEFFELDDVLKLRDLAREVLDDRALRIFFAIHFEDNSRKEVSDRLGLTSQRVGQMYNGALRALQAHPDYPFKPPLEVEQLTQGGTDD